MLAGLNIAAAMVVSKDKDSARHFPNATVPTFPVLFVTTNEYHCVATAKEIAKKPRPEL